MCPYEFRRSERKRELRRPENKQLDGQTFLTGAAWNKIRLNAKQNLTGFHASLLHPVPRVRLKPPLPMNTNLHPCGREANQNSVTMPGLKQRLQVMFLGPKKASEAFSEHPISKNFPGEAYPQTPPGLILRANVRICEFAYTSVGSNFASAGPVVHLQKGEEWFLCPFVLYNQPVPPKVVLQPAKAVSMCTACHDNAHPPPLFHPIY